MVLVPYAGKYFGRKCAYWGGFSCFFFFFSFSVEDMGKKGKDRGERKRGRFWGGSGGERR